MAGKPKLEEYEEAICFYDKLSKLRPLEEHELERLIWLSNRVRDLKRERRYRERHKEEIRIRERNRRYTKEGKTRLHYKKKDKRNNAARYRRDPEKHKKRYQDWKAKNPELYAAQLLKKNQLRNPKKYGEYVPEKS